VPLVTLTAKSVVVGVLVCPIWKCIIFLQQLTESTIIFAVKRDGTGVFGAVEVT